MSIHLGGGLYTKESCGPDRRLRRFAQLLADLAGKQIDQLRVLDLACLEGQYAIEFAMHGASVVGIEIRKANIEKARFGQWALGLHNVEFIQDDVRNLSREKYGGFDVVLCSGMLYHLDAPDVFDFVRGIYDVCDRLAIFDTFISLRDTETFEHAGHTYKGLQYIEHDEQASAEEKCEALWSSIDNTRSFWLTHSSLCNLLSHTGFTSVLQCHVPTMVNVGDDRLTYVAMKGQRVSILSSQLTDQFQEEDWPERRVRRVSSAQYRRGKLWNFCKSNLPQPVKNLIKPFLRAVGLMPPDETPDWLKQRKLEQRKKRSESRQR